MKTVHLLLKGQPGGIESLVHDIAKHSGNDVVYFIFEGGPIADKMIASGIPVVIADSPRFFWIGAIIRFITFCQKENVDVVINHFEAPIACAFVCALKKMNDKIKVLSYWHLDMRDVVKGWKGKLLYRPCNLLMYKCCDRIVAISEFVKQAGTMACGLPECGVEVVYNGIDLARFTAEESEDVHENMKLIYVGRLIREKGVHILLQALAKLPDEMNVHTTIVGYGPEYDSLLQQTDVLGLGKKVLFLGKRTDIPQLLKDADFFVHPAIWQEGFGITLVEAMASGKPCVASCGGAIKEIVDENCGFLFELGNVDSLTEAIRCAYACCHTPEYKKMSQAAKGRSACFSVEKTAERLSLLYSQLSKN